jgi:hypothetical protein
VHGAVQVPENYTLAVVLLYASMDMSQLPPQFNWNGQGLETSLIPLVNTAAFQTVAQGLVNLPPALKVTNNTLDIRLCGATYDVGENYLDRYSQSWITSYPRVVSWQVMVDGFPMTIEVGNNN